MLYCKLCLKMQNNREYYLKQLSQNVKHKRLEKPNIRRWILGLFD